MYDLPLFLFGEKKKRRKKKSLRKEYGSHLKNHTLLTFFWAPFLV